MPPKNIVWIKLYRDLLNDYKFNQLSPEEKWYFVGLLLLYPECNKAIPNDEKWLVSRLGGGLTDFGQKLDRIIKLFGWRVRNGKIYIKNFDKYQHYKKLDSGIDKVYTKSIVDKSRIDVDKNRVDKKNMQFNYHSFQEAHNPEFMNFLKEAYPNVHVEFEFKRMETWLGIHPSNKYKNYGKFCRNWIDRTAKEFQSQPPEPKYEQPPMEYSEKERLQAQAALAKKVKELAEAKKL